MRKLIIGLLVLAGLAVVIDFGAAAYSEYRVSRALRVGADLSADPEVTIHGFPFLSQALDSRYQSVGIRAQVVRPDISGQIYVEANMTGVRLPFGDLSEGNVRRVPVEKLDARMVIEPVELGRLFDIPDLQVHSRPADKSDGTGGSGGSGMTTADGLILTGTLPGLVTKPGGNNARLSGDRVSVQAELRLVGDQVEITATGFYRGAGPELPPSTAEVPEADRPAVLAMFSRIIDTKELPFGIKPTKVFALGGQIHVEGKGENVTIDLDRLQRP
ncbi:LmeA family phospholipid-binding protein [Nocardia arizonensis]|uniref:LmeA family phospholipid-binding protein n=1 Tax=Nocardia arizonensis TaxID=1141647 RepID=UPI0006D0C3D2|nr:LmeA family phospholipid-binding protein [Nocardia arizonensis]